MSKWVVLITENGALLRHVFDDKDELLQSMRMVVDASQTWNQSRFQQWVLNAKAGQWIELRDFQNRVRALVVRSSDPKGWWNE